MDKWKIAQQPESGQAVNPRAHDGDLLQFCAHSSTLKITPAMAAGVTPKLWEMADMVAALEEWETSRGAA